MPTEASLSLANLDRKNIPNIASALNLLEPQPILNGLYRFEHKEQAFNLPVSHRYNVIQPITTVSSTFFNSSSNFIDFNLPMNIDLIDETTLEFTIANASGVTAWVANASVPNWFDRVEIREGTNIIQTIRDLDLYLDNTIYLNDFERAKNVPKIALDATSYQVNTSAGTVGTSSSNTYRMRIANVLTKCQIFMKAIRPQLVLRVYPKPISSFSSSTVNSSITLTAGTLLVRELQLTTDGKRKLMDVHRQNVDYRFLDPVHDQFSGQAMTSGTTIKLKTTNFQNSVYSHVLALTRASSPTLANLETFIQHSNVYFEDSASQNLSNGIQWSDGDLREIVYQSHFPNTMTLQTNMNVYVPLVGSMDPVKSYTDGVNLGWDVLPYNANVCIMPSSTSTYQVDVVAYVYRHARVEGGKLCLY